MHYNLHQQEQISIDDVISSATNIQPLPSSKILRASLIPTGQEEDFDCMPDDILLRSTSKKPERSSISMLASLKYEDPSLKKYRQTLTKQFQNFCQGQRPEILLKQISINQKQEQSNSFQNIPQSYQRKYNLIPIQEKGLICYHLQKCDMLKLKQNTKYVFKLKMKIKKQIIYGLTMTNNVYKSFIKIDKKEEVVGSYGPGQHNIEMQILTPGGFLGRGEYGCKIILADKEGWVYGKIQYQVCISHK